MAGPPPTDAAPGAGSNFCWRSWYYEAKAAWATLLGNSAKELGEEKGRSAALEKELTATKEELQAEREKNQLSERSATSG